MGPPGGIDGGRRGSTFGASDFDDFAGFELGGTFYIPPSEFEAVPAPPSPPPPEPLAPWQANDRPNWPDAPPAPPPEPVTPQLIRAIIQRDLPVVTANVSRSVNNTVAAATMALFGSSISVALNRRLDTVVATSRSGRGRVVGFGGLRQITQCCRPPNLDGMPASDPDFDKLVVNSADWVSEPARLDSRRRAQLRVSDEIFVPVAEYLVKMLPKTFYQLEYNVSALGPRSSGRPRRPPPPAPPRGRGRKQPSPPPPKPSRNSGDADGDENTAQPKSWVIRIDMLAAKAARGKDTFTDVLIMGAYELEFLDPRTQEALRSWVARGKGLMVVGPDVMPSTFYRRSPPPAAAARGARTPAPSPAPAPASGSRKRKRRLGERGEGDQGDDGTYAFALGGIDINKIDLDELWHLELTAGYLGRSARRGRSLQQVSVPTAFQTDDLPVNGVTGPMGIVFTGLVSNPGGNLTVGAPTSLTNADLAAQQYLGYLQGTVVLTATQLEVVSSTLTKARSLVPANSPGAESFWKSVDQIDQIQAAGPGAGPLGVAVPPPPTGRGGATPASGPTPTSAAPTGSGGALPAGVSYQGCYKDSAVERALPVLLTPSLDRANSVEKCLALAKAHQGSGTPASPYAITYIGLQRFQCWGGDSLQKHEALGALAASECSLTCPGNAAEACGGAPSGASVASSVYYIT